LFAKPHTFVGTLLSKLLILLVAALAQDLLL
jgi:hypothetical protein